MFDKLERYQLAILGLILALGLFFAVKTAVSGMSKDSVSVTGSAYEIVQSDSGSMELVLNVRKTTKSIAIAEAAKQIPIVVQFLKDNGFKPEDIDVKAANGYNSYKYSANGNMTNEIAYYNLSQSVNVKSNDVNIIKNASLNIQTLAEKGIDIDAQRVQYSYSKLSDLKVKLLEEATKDAKVRAGAMLKSTHNRVGKIQSVKMGVFQITPVDSTDVTDYGISDTSTIEKKITSVANVVFQIK
ncbi:SIMPL domain-containing protein [bacterium]|nr:SIMPL domain-containing protein [bacterium]